MPPASVTKVMTLLLILEGCESGKISTEDEVIISERAASMGGSQMAEPVRSIRWKNCLKV
ncbi:MAG: serine hydrolase [Anaerovoracaceae bacterium]